MVRRFILQIISATLSESFPIFATRERSAASRFDGDVAARLLAESRTEAATLIRQIERTLGESRAILEPGEEAAIRAAIAALQAAAADTDHNQIPDVAQSLNDVSTPFAHRIMEASIKRALEHKTAGGGTWA